MLYKEISGLLIPMTAERTAFGTIFKWVQIVTEVGYRVVSVTELSGKGN
jgi:hypothetical protein